MQLAVSLAGVCTEAALDWWKSEAACHPQAWEPISAEDLIQEHAPLYFVSIEKSPDGCTDEYKSKCPTNGILKLPVPVPQSGKLTDNPGALNGSMQHWLEVY